MKLFNILIILLMSIKAFSTQLNQNLPDIRKIMSDQSLTVIPVMSVVQGKKTKLSQEFISSFDQNGNWSENRYGKKLIKPSTFKFISLKPITYYKEFSYAGKTYKQYTICDKATATCEYSMGYFSEKGDYLGSSVGKLVFHNKDLFKGLQYGSE
ncbi:hypothetical protein [Francisella sp. 19X1-34]|uniref:hypothetical protein n=1 Tax=Francisella sp. 19X1-34 TaxID=3087177 RepID=UPI002E3780EC|nr:hypothetical protein [Francisella sp. 19X1-34]MED7788039.1 hypothetical protein [Francisella sp. 19X1-34]